jgi:hypothetical protein
MYVYALQASRLFKSENLYIRHKKGESKMILRNEQGKFIKGSRSYSTKGKKLSEEHRKKISESLIGNIRSKLGAAASNI